MDSHRWRDEDGAWLYNTAPRTYIDSHGKYRTLPGPDYKTYSKDVEIPRRPHRDRGIYSTIPGRLVERRPMKHPNRVLPNSQPGQSSILQDSTNWTPSLPQGARGPKLLRTDQKINAGGRDERQYEDPNKMIRKHAREQDRKRRKMLKETQADSLNLSSSDRHRLMAKHMEDYSLYGEWEPDYYKWEKKKVAKRDDTESFLSQLTSHTPKIPLRASEPQLDKEKSAVQHKEKQIQEKKRWWFKSPKQPKGGGSDLPAIKHQELLDNIYAEGGSKISNEFYKIQFTKENQVQRKQRQPPPYVPPPSYNSSHRILSTCRKKNISNILPENKLVSGGVPVACTEKCEKGDYKVPQCNAESLNIPKLTPTSHMNLHEGSQWAAAKQKYDLQAYQNIKWDRKPNPFQEFYSQWQVNQPHLKANTFSDHIYETVAGEDHSLMPTMSYAQVKNPGLHTDEMTYGTMIIPQQYVLPRTTEKGSTERKGITKMTRDKVTMYGGQHYTRHFDVSRPPIPSQDLKLARDLGYSYTNDKLHYLSKRGGADNKHSIQPDEDGGSKGERTLRVVSSKQSRSREQPASFTGKGTYGWYSHTLPWKKDVSDSMKTAVLHRKDPVYSSKQRWQDGDSNLPKWREPRRINTLPGRSHDQNFWRQYEDYKHRDRNGQLTETVPPQKEPQRSKENDGLFVIDATCVVIRAEFIPPPKMERVRFITEQQVCQGQTTEDIVDFQEYSRDRKISHLADECETNVGNTTNRFEQSVPTKREVPNMQERAKRILGLSADELDDARPHLERNKFPGNRAKMIALAPCTEESQAALAKRNVTEEDYSERCQEVLSSQTVAIRNNQEVCPLSCNSSKRVCNSALDATCHVDDAHSLTSKNNINMTADDIDRASVEFQVNAKSKGNRSAPQLHGNTSAKMEPKASLMEHNDAHNTENTDTICVNWANTENANLIIEQKVMTSKDNTGPASEHDKQHDSPARGKTKHFSAASGQIHNREGAEHEVKSVKLDGHVANLYEAQSGQSKLLSPATDQTHSYSPPEKPYAKKYNYFAKDLREAVSRIRRHTAPDSDTDEDLDRSSSCSGSVDYKATNEEVVTSCSSDTSDSEVTVILSKGQTEEEVESSCVEAQPACDVSGDVLHGESAAMMTSVFATDVVTECSNLDSHQEGAAGLDLNSCIEEILQDLNRTQQEFFSLQ
ncbi:uncharacterized protein LOC121400045 [Xenopus laevis]|uniref:Uncharacterized protein LOC121400045 n=2 Tax=Xenopus laevis TaxID=8355 RepID=A0A1L8HHY8_XENLA|nr:uncharacterized protein LOC121400045 [Xenopus laevis]OCT95631.1 hypothetical protein XELAEV_18013319mg [Xenopus laevis]